MTKPDDKPKSPRDLRRQVREVADSLAIAFILAMVIRHYILEVFKIPTKSMEPTLLGDPWSGDKILVNKFIYDFRDPRRWEVAVFKYPRDTTKNYIKRVVGLPGETLRILHGDVYVDGRIARKPWAVQQALWRLCPHSGEAKSWKASGETGRASPRLADGEFTLESSDAAGTLELEYDREILAYEAPDDAPPGRVLPRQLTSDIMVQFLLVPGEDTGSLSVGIDVTLPDSPQELVDRWEVDFPLGGSAGPVAVKRSGTPFAVGAPCKLRRGQATLVQVCNVDHTLLVRVDGAEAVRAEYEPSRRFFEWGGLAGQAHVRLACRQAQVALRDPAIYVDVYYTVPGKGNRYGVSAPYPLGTKEFFALGDNSVNSNDSRGWGIVPRSYLVGEAFLVLWPLGRMKLVR